MNMVISYSNDFPHHWDTSVPTVVSKIVSKIRFTCQTFLIEMKSVLFNFYFEHSNLQIFELFK